MAKRVVIETPLYYDEDVTNYVAIHPEDVAFSCATLVEIVNKHGVFKFTIVIQPSITSGAIGLNRRQRKKYRLKLYHSYIVRLSLYKPSVTLFDIINTKFNFRSRIGGMERVFEEIFGDVLLPRLYPTSFVAKTGMSKTRGVLLHGPPGTGKTLIARTICDILEVDPKIVRGPEIFSFMLGESERKIRDLFEDARCDQQNYGCNSKLHVIIFDEIDAICKSRAHHGTVRDNVQDNVTTQLLAEIDGMIYLDNIFIIGTTNILEAVDSALLRPGRIEKVIKIELPNAAARSDIFDIHTESLIRNGALHQDVDIDNIIRSTHGMTGAHVEQVVRLAIHAAMRRDIVERGTLDISPEEGEQLEVKNQDCIEALQKIRLSFMNESTAN